MERRPAKEIFDFIISECDEIKDLIIENYENLGDWEPSNEARETGRANKRTVLALKARALCMLPVLYLIRQMTETCGIGLLLPIKN